MLVLFSMYGTVEVLTTGSAVGVDNKVELEEPVVP
jgi:hypothetical protein